MREINCEAFFFFFFLKQQPTLNNSTARNGRRLRRPPNKLTCWHKVMDDLSASLLFQIDFLSSLMQLIRRESRGGGTSDRSVSKSINIKSVILATGSVKNRRHCGTIFSRKVNVTVSTVIKNTLPTIFRSKQHLEINRRPDTSQ